MVTSVLAGTGAVLAEIWKASESVERRSLPPRRVSSLNTGLMMLTASISHCLQPSAIVLKSERSIIAPYRQAG